MAYRIDKFNISLKFNCNGYLTGNKFLKDKDLQNVFLFNFVTDKENISASAMRVEGEINVKEYVALNLKSFEKLQATNFISREKDGLFYAFFELKNKKVLQIYFLRKNVFYCFSATLTEDAYITDRNLLLNGTTRRMQNIIKSIKDLS